jgi:hypothetical protein
VSTIFGRTSLCRLQSGVLQAREFAGNSMEQHTVCQAGNSKPGSSGVSTIFGRTSLCRLQSEVFQASEFAGNSMEQHTAC